MTQVREIALDTETTGLDPRSGHRIVEIGCVELSNHVPTGEVYHTYVNPERDMPEEAFQVHGLSEDFLRDQPLFSAVAGDFLSFLGDAPLIIHNASFDLGFINAELERLNHEMIERARAIDTVELARKKFPGSPANLDALCRRFEIDITDRQLHGALKDSRLLAGVYLELIGGRQVGLDLAVDATGRQGAVVETSHRTRAPRAHAPSPEELEAHASFVETLKDPIWQAG